MCKYIAKMGELDNSDDVIHEMLYEMYPNYKSKPAFKQEIMCILDKNRK